MRDKSLPRDTIVRPEDSRAVARRNRPRKRELSYSELGRRAFSNLIVLLLLTPMPRPAQPLTLQNAKVVPSSGIVSFSFSGYTSPQQLFATTLLDFDIEELRTYVVTTTEYLWQSAKYWKYDADRDLENMTHEDLSKAMRSTVGESTRKIFMRLSDSFRLHNRIGQMQLFMISKDEALKRYISENPTASDNLQRWQIHAGQFDPNSYGDPHVRHKRLEPTTIAAVIAIVGTIASTIATYYTQNEIANQRAELRDALLRHSLMHTLDVGTTQEEIADLVNSLKDGVDQWKHVDYLVELAEAIFQTIERRLDMFEEAIQQSMLGNCPVKALLERDMAEIIYTVETQAAKRGLIPIASTVSDVAQFQCNFIGDGNNFSVVMYIPLTHTESTLEVYRHTETPVQLPDGRHVIVRPRDRHYLAINRDRSMFRSFTPVEFEQCRRHGQYLDCARGLPLTLATDRLTKIAGENDEACLYNMFRGNFDRVLENCILVNDAPTDSVTQLSIDTFAVYTTSHAKATISCDSSSYNEAFTNEQLSIVTVNTGCTVTTATHKFSGPSNLFSTGPARQAMQWQEWPRTLLSAMQDIPEDPILSKFTAKYEGIKKRITDTNTAIRKTIADYDQRRASLQFKEDIAPYIGIGVGGLAVIICAALFLFHRRLQGILNKLNQDFPGVKAMANKANNAIAKLTKGNAATNQTAPTVTASAAYQTPAGSSMAERQNLLVLAAPTMQDSIIAYPRENLGDLAFHRGGSQRGSFQLNRYN